MNRRVDLITVPSALGAPDVGVAGGPQALLEAGLVKVLADGGIAVERMADVAPGLHEDRWDGLADLCGRVAARVATSLGAGSQPLVVGGDHAIAAGTWRGVAGLHVRPVGLLWIDAHLDAHTRDDSPTGNPHGMAVALLLGEGDPRLARACLSPCHVCVVGARSWEPPERRRLERLGVRIFDADEIRRRGLGAVMTEARQRVSAGSAGFGISLDVDVFDPADAPGVNTPCGGGRPAQEWLGVLRGLAASPRCLGLEIVECDAGRDKDGMTARLAVAATAALLWLGGEG